MQDKSLDAMAKKYKEEMMRLYAGNQSNMRQNAPQANAVTTVSQQKASVQAGSEKRTDTERLMHPPMPKIPAAAQNSEQEHTQSHNQEHSENSAENMQKSKFPSPDELVASEIAQNMIKNTVPNTAQNAVQDTAPSAVQDTAQSDTAPRFDNDHEQGNYDFTEAEHDRELFRDGEGYLKLEVTAIGQPVDCALAVVSRFTDSGDVLVATFFTDAKGETEVMTLPVLGLDERYTVTVAKEGFYTVHNLEIPIFDSIKSIQPVELKQEKINN